MKHAIKLGSRVSNTLAAPASLEGVGIHTGQAVSLRLVPAELGAGIVFCRTDLPGNPRIPALADHAQLTPRNTTLKADGAEVATVEHLLAALRAFEIDDLLVEVSGPELPIAGGDAQEYVRLIQTAGVAQRGEVDIFGLSQPIAFSDGPSHLVALPSDTYRVSATIHYPQVPAICSQHYSTEVDADAFCKELAPCRTFALYEEVKPLLDAGLIQGGSLDSAVVVKGDAVLNKDGLRFDDEMVRHKVLDVIGDLALVGVDFRAHIIAICPGHRANAQLAKRIREEL